MEKRWLHESWERLKKAVEESRAGKNNYHARSSTSGVLRTVKKKQNSMCYPEPGSHWMFLLKIAQTFV